MVYTADVNGVAVKYVYVCVIGPAYFLLRAPDRRSCEGGDTHTVTLTRIESYQLWRQWSSGDTTHLSGVNI